MGFFLSSSLSFLFFRWFFLCFMGFCLVLVLSALVFSLVFGVSVLFFFFFFVGCVYPILPSLPLLLFFVIIFSCFFLGLVVISSGFFLSFGAISSGFFLSFCGIVIPYLT